ncbi:MAG: signal peptidase I [Lachnospiraceae bacterium]|nr:signal peptidase I [Lachnospiraceae bacterium]
MSNSRATKNKTSKGIIKLLLYFVIMMTITYAFIGLLSNKHRNLFGYTARIVVTGSMEPNIRINSINIIELCDINDINIGDIVCFNYSQDIVHRVIEKTTNEDGELIIHTKGDANESADSIEINNSMIVGKVVYTFNGVSDIINRYSIAPGQIDGVSLSRNVMTAFLFICCIIYLLSWILSILKIIFRSFGKNDRFNKSIDKYIKDIDELILYRELLLELKNNNVKNNKDTRFEFIGNRIARAKAEVEINNIHMDIKEFKSKIRHCMYFNKLGELMDKEGKSRSISDIIKQCKDID